jgi:hypothetical protein
MDFKNKIYRTVKGKESIFLVGKSNSGKTFFIKNELIPFLESKGLKVCYFSNCDKIIITTNKEVAIVDEVETFQDKDFLEGNNRNKKAYFNKQYIQKVNRWFEKLNNLKITSIYILTRNNENELRQLERTIKTADWDNRKVKIITFEK